MKKGGQCTKLVHREQLARSKWLEAIVKSYRENKLPGSHLSLLEEYQAMSEDVINRLNLSCFFHKEVFSPSLKVRLCRD